MLIKDAAEAKAIVCHYESYISDHKLLPLAYYYLGRTYSHNNNFPMALEYYKKSMDVVGDNDLKLRSVLNFQIGYLLLQQSFSHESLKYFKESLRLEEMRKDSAMISYCLQKIAYAYQEEDNDSCCSFYSRAIKIARSCGDRQLCDEMKSSLASYYIEKGKYAVAKELALPIMLSMDHDNRAKDSFYDILGSSYFGLGEVDSALYYFNQLYKLNGLEAKTEASLQLAHIYKVKGNLNKSFYYLTQYEQSNDSLKRVNVASSIARMNALFNYSAYKERSISLESSRYKVVVCLVLVAFILVFGVVLFVLWYRRERRKAKIQELNWLCYKQELEERSENSIKEKDALISKLQLQLQGVHDQALASDILQQKEELIYKRDIIRKKQNLEDNIRLHFAASDMFRLLCQKVNDNKCLTGRELERFDRKIIELLPDFVSNINSVCHISQQDLRMCALIKLCDFNSTQIATLLGRDKSTISKAKKKLLLSIVGEKSGNTDFNEYVRMM